MDSESIDIISRNWSGETANSFADCCPAIKIIVPKEEILGLDHLQPFPDAKLYLAIGLLESGPEAHPLW